MKFRIKIGLVVGLGVLLCVAAAALPLYLPVHQQMLNMYYGIMGWTAGLLVLQRALTMQTTRGCGRRGEPEEARFRRSHGRRKHDKFNYQRGE